MGQWTIWDEGMKGWKDRIGLTLVTQTSAFYIFLYNYFIHISRKKKKSVFLNVGGPQNKYTPLSKHKTPALPKYRHMWDGRINKALLTIFTPHTR